MEITKNLNQLLADYQIFYQNLRGFHWNIRGKFFFELHAKFEEMYTDSATKIDEIAERILSIGDTPLHTYADYLEVSHIKPAKDVANDEAAVKSIADSLDHLIEEQRKVEAQADEQNDSGTADLMSTYIEQQEKNLWMFKAWLG